MLVNQSGTKVFVDGDNNKAAKAKFAVASIRNGKGDDAEDFFVINKDGTKVFIDEESQDKAAKATFAVASVKKSKAGENDNLLVVNDEGTQVFIDGDGTKAAKSKFAVTGKRASKGNTSDLLKVTQDSTRFYIDDFNVDLRKDAISINNNSQLNLDWYPGKGVFTDGKSESTSASFSKGIDENAGIGSFTTGSGNQATGEYAQAMGYNSKAEGNYSTAIGLEAYAKGMNSYAFGEKAKAQGLGSYAFGTNAEAITNGSFAIGTGAKADGESSIALGSGATANNMYSTALGRNASAIGNYSTALGGTTSSTQYSTAVGYGANAAGEGSVALGVGTISQGNYSSAIGNSTTAYSFGETAIGRYNEEYSAKGTDNWDLEDKLFVIGNGQSENSKSDALVVYKTGNMTVNGTLTHNGLVGPSDFRLKKDIQQLDGALDKVLKLRGVSFYWKSKEEMAAAKGKDVKNMSYGFSSEKQIGVIAQEIEEVLPELVVTDNEGFKAVKYENITPLLIEAIKELKAEKDAQDKKIEALEAQLKEILEKLDKQ